MKVAHWIAIDFSSKSSVTESLSQYHRHGSSRSIKTVCIETIPKRTGCTLSRKCELKYELKIYDSTLSNFRSWSTMKIPEMLDHWTKRTKMLAPALLELQVRLQIIIYCVYFTFLFVQRVVMWWNYRLELMMTERLSMQSSRRSAVDLLSHPVLWRLSGWKAKHWIRLALWRTPISLKNCVCRRSSFIAQVNERHLNAIKYFHKLFLLF